MLNNTSTERFRKSLDYSLVGVIPPYVPSKKEYDMSAKRILFVAGDRGGWNAMEPVVALALQNEMYVSVVFTDTCYNQHLNGGLTLDHNIRFLNLTTSRMQSNLGTFEFDLMVVGASQSPEGSQSAYEAIMAAGLYLVPCMTIQDMYGSFSPTLALLRESKAINYVNCICVSDEFSRDIILREYALPHAITVTGGPQFDKAIEMKRPAIWEERRRILHNVLGCTEDQLVFLIAGGLNGTDEILEVLEGGIEQADLFCDPIVILRNHPRATYDDKRRTQEFLERTTHKSWFKDVPRDLAPTSDDLLPGVHFVLSGYSTTNHFGILYRMSGVVYVGTPAFRADHLKEKGTETPPQVEAGAGWYVQRPEQMDEVISMNAPNQQDRLLKLNQAQQRIAQYNDGHATDRVWQQIQQLMA